MTSAQLQQICGILNGKNSKQVADILNGSILLWDAAPVLLDEMRHLRTQNILMVEVVRTSIAYFKAVSSADAHAVGVALAEWQHAVSNYSRQQTEAQSEKAAPTP
jgi:hypothetical protein